MRKIFQLTHEVIHVLSGSDKNGAINFEEGLACLFSRICLEKIQGGLAYFEESIETNKKYKIAYTNVIKLLEHDTEAIRKLRNIEPRTSKTTADSFKKAKVNVSDTKLIEYLVKDFNAMEITHYDDLRNYLTDLLDSTPDWIEPKGFSGFDGFPSFVQFLNAQNKGMVIWKLKFRYDQRDAIFSKIIEFTERTNEFLKDILGVVHSLMPNSSQNELQVIFVFTLLSSKYC
jgi:hypothetical protein